MAALPALPGFVLAFVLAAKLTPALARGARELGIVDRPDGRLKTQAEAVPYLGGMAIYLAFLLATCALTALDKSALTLLLGGTLLAMLGLFDDLHALPPGMKLLGQAMGTWVLLRAGVMVQLVFLPAWLQLLVTVLWLLTSTNACNILDVSDGLATGVLAVAAVGLAAVTYAAQPQLGALALTLAGSLLGFLPFNVRPARIYLGDTGTLFLGFVLGALMLHGQYTDPYPWAALCPVLLLGVPLLDLVVVCAVRGLRGHNPMRGSPDHVALVLRRRGWQTQQVARLGWATSAAWALLAYLLAHGPRAASLAALALHVVVQGLLVGLLVRCALKDAKKRDQNRACRGQRTSAPPVPTPDPGGGGAATA